ncbi:TetR family transcriptional regulator [Pseudohalocynthiibacter aestuariivivens]|nr:TetR family transcriptional regulator C-terminal domain-containing protein [Pseudohalocynthiibacter aestuariivivens]QIE47158.1 TetR family transcriptional regulator [Pseudohalocynthiibacter aestuariivivens]
MATTDANRPEGKKSAPRRTASKEVRRSQLIDATINSIAKHGIAGTTMSTVTEFAGLSIGIVNFHFKSKQNLLDETLMHLAREHHDHWWKYYRDAGLNAPEKLLAIVDAHFHPRICTRKKIAVWYAFYGEAGRRARYRDLVDEIDDERFDVSQALCQEIIDDGPHYGPPATQIAKTLEGLYDGICLNILMYPDQFSRDQAKAQIRAYLASVFPGNIDMPIFDEDDVRGAQNRGSG